MEEFAGTSDLPKRTLQIGVILRAERRGEPERNIRVLVAVRGPPFIKLCLAVTLIVS